MILRAIQQQLKTIMLVIVVASLTLVPLWQSVGHATDTEHSLTAVQDADTFSPRLGQVGNQEADHHLAADHGHELPILRLATILRGGSSSDRWPSPASSIGDGTELRDPGPPPRGS